MCLKMLELAFVAILAELETGLSFDMLSLAFCTCDALLHSKSSNFHPQKRIYRQKCHFLRSEALV